MKIFILLMIFSSSICLADTYRYIAHAERFDAKTDRVVFDESKKSVGDRTLKEFGKTGQPQPSENTQFIVVKNTDVAFIEVTFNDDGERELFEKMNSDGRLRLFDISRIVADRSGKRVERVFSDKILVDINKDWSVDESSK